MTRRPLPGPVRRTLVAGLLVLPLALATLVALPAEADRGGGRGGGRAELTVMTQNLYLGSSLQPAVLAQSEGEFLRAVATIWANVGTTDFPRRSEAIAAGIAHERPDLVGLQEVARWTRTDARTGESQVLDFLEVLLADLAGAGASYSVAAVSDNAAIGPVPLAAPCDGDLGDCLLTFRDRDVILVNDAVRRLRVTAAQSGRFTAQVVVPTPAGALSFDRGWAAVDGKLRGRPFRFVNTHLETDDFPPVQEAQAVEFLAGPARARRSVARVIAVGDFNSPADGSTTASYELLTGSFRDAWRARSRSGFTCCQGGLLSNPASELDTRIDLVLTRGRVRARRTQVVGDTPFQAVVPLWPSDHAGVVSRVRLR